MKSYYSEELSARVCYEDEAQAEIDAYRKFIKLHADMHPIDRVKFMDFLNKHEGE